MKAGILLALILFGGSSFAGVLKTNTPYDIATISQFTVRNHFDDKNCFVDINLTPTSMEDHDKKFHPGDHYRIEFAVQFYSHNRLERKLVHSASMIHPTTETDLQDFSNQYRNQII